jgi:uncharacterized protein (TIGR02444 family)
MSLWEWAVEAYARPGVEPACLALQDEHGQSVPYLLWAAWAAAEGCALDDAILNRASAEARRWEDAAVVPLRAARRGLKAPDKLVPEAAREALRARVQSAELEAERLLLLALERLSPEPAAAPVDLAAALAAASRAWGPAAPEPSLAALAAALYRA